MMTLPIFNFFYIFYIFSNIFQYFSLWIVNSKNAKLLRTPGQLTTWILVEYFPILYEDDQKNFIGEEKV